VLREEDQEELLKRCYSSQAKAVQASAVLTCLPGQFKQFHSIHLWNNGQRLPRNNDGTVDLGPWWKNPVARPNGDWDNDPRTPIDEGVNFDFGAWDPIRKRWWHGDHYHNPDIDGNKLGDYFPLDAINQGGQVISSTNREWRSYIGPDLTFDTSVYCISCGGTPDVHDFERRARC
jgi:hypothetical protein